MTAETFVPIVALVGVVILVASLLSGLVERRAIPHVAILLLLGTALGPAGLGLVELSLESRALQIIATLALVLVLFTDAMSVDVAELRARRGLAALVLGPGTILSAALVALGAWLLLGLSLPAAAILGGALASTDPVLLRSLVRSAHLPPDARIALRLESGMNDVVLLPVVVLAMLLARPAEAGLAGEIGERALGLFVLGPALGAVVGWIAITALTTVRDRFGIRRDYESLYALGVAFVAFAVAEAVGGSGFLSAFTAGLVIAALDVELCDCFLDYGEASSEMFLLFTFVALGASLIWLGLEVVAPRTLLFAAIALGARTIVLLPLLARAGVAPRERHLIAWLGPRGLSALLLVLLPVFAGMPGAERLFAIASLVVLLSVLLHGTAISLFLRRGGRSAPGSAGGVAPRPPAREPAAAATVPAAPEVPAENVPERIELDEVRALEAAGEPVALVDVRKDRAFAEDPRLARGAVRLSPDDAVRDAAALRLSQHGTVVLYCA